MSIQLIDVKDKKIHKILTEPKLFACTYGQGCNVTEFTVDETSQYLYIKEEDEDIGIIQFKPFTKITVEIHLNVLPKYWGNEKSIAVLKAGRDWFKKETHFTKAITSVPANCGYMFTILKKINWVPCGLVKKGIIYNNQEVDLILFEFEI